MGELISGLIALAIIVGGVSIPCFLIRNIRREKMIEKLGMQERERMVKSGEERISNVEKGFLRLVLVVSIIGGVIMGLLIGNFWGGFQFIFIFAWLLYAVIWFVVKGFKQGERLEKRFLRLVFMVSIIGGFWGIMIYRDAAASWKGFFLVFLPVWLLYSIIVFIVRGFKKK